MATITGKVLWARDRDLGGVKISFRIRRKDDKHAEIVFGNAEDTRHVKVQCRDLEAMEDVFAAKAAVMQANSPLENEEQSIAQRPER